MENGRTNINEQLMRRQVRGKKCERNGNGKRMQNRIVNSVLGIRTQSQRKTIKKASGKHTHRRQKENTSKGRKERRKKKM